MAPRTGRPRTGRKPNFIVRMNPEHAAAARQSARDAGKQVGQWLEEAITEKQEREKGEEDVTKADLLIRNIKNHHPVVPYVAVHMW